MADQNTSEKNVCGCDYSNMPLPEVDFNTFVLSLYSSALVHLGEAPDPATGKTEFSRHLAKHTIDILGLLESKTKGNLTEDEERNLCSILCRLRMQFVAKTT